MLIGFTFLLASIFIFNALWCFSPSPSLSRWVCVRARVCVLFRWKLSRISWLSWFSGDSNVFLWYYCFSSSFISTHSRFLCLILHIPFAALNFKQQAYKLKIENSLGIILSHMARILLKSSTILELGKVLKTPIAFAQIGQASEHFLIPYIYKKKIWKNDLNSQCAHSYCSIEWISNNTRWNLSIPVNRNIN